MLISKEKFASIQDHAIVEPYCTIEDTIRFAEETLKYGFAGVFVLPCHVKMLREKFGDKLTIGTAIDFPAGNMTTKAKVYAGLDIIDDGADIIDTVINISHLVSGDVEYCKKDLKECVSAWKAKKPDLTVKVIIECCYLTQEQKKQAVECVLESGADVIKTSTGTGTWGCRPGDVRLIRGLVGDRLKIKAAADMKDVNQALAAIAAGADQIGENSAVQYLKDFDANIGNWDGFTREWD